MFSLSVTQFMQEFCKPYQKVALTSFMHDITFGNGQISMLVNHPEIFLFYYRHKIPMLCTNQSGRTLADGVYLNKILEENNKDCAVLMPLMVKVARKHNQNYGKNSLHIVAREANCQHLYSLFFDLSESDFLHWIVNNGNLIQDLIDNYNKKANDVIAEAKQRENRIILPSYFSSSKMQKSNEQLRLFHHTMHMPIYLSRQQSRCLALLMQGKTAKEVGHILQLSHRTVEHYFEKIRQMLDCSSNRELMAFYSDQFGAV